MNNTVTISCTIGTTDPAASIGLEVWVDNTKLFDTDHVREQLTLEWQLAEDDADHDLRFIMKNKTSEHTLVDDSGQIVEDTRLVIHDICFDKISLGQLVSESTTYTHDFNGTKDTCVDQFFGEMGCNGTVSLKFTTPIYIWLLENM